MKDKILNFLLIFLLLFTILSYFNKPKETQTQTSGLVLTTQKSYVVPATVQVTITNYSAWVVILNTCKDLSIKKGTIDIQPEKCMNVTMQPQQHYRVDYTNSYKKFYDLGDYLVSLKYQGSEYVASFEIRNPWFFSKIFRFFLYAPVYNLMVFLLELSHYSLGWSIILITIIIRLILLYPQHKMMVSQRKLQVLQPKIKDIQDKHKGDHQTLGVEMMKLYKEHKVNPFGSCGLLLLQMPILIVIYQIILHVESVSNMYYLYSFFGDYQVSSINPDFYGMSLMGVWGLQWLILAISIAVLQFVQVKLSLTYNKTPIQPKGVVLEKKKDADDYSQLMPDPEMLNKFMLYGLPVMIGFFSYSFFAWVGLYWWMGTAFMIVQQWVVNKIVKK